MEKILVIVSRYSRNKADPGDFITELSEFINNKDFSVSVLAPHDYNLKFEEKINSINVYRFPYFFPYKYQKIAYGPGILDNLKKSSLALIQVPFFIISQLIYAIKIIYVAKISIIHSHWIIPQGLIGAICSKIFKIRHITTIHGSDINMTKDNWFLKKVCNLIIDNSNYVTVNSRFTEKLLLKTINKKNLGKVIVIPMGVNVNKFFSLKENVLNQKYNDENIIIYVGRLIDWKGVRYLLFALGKVLKTHPKTRLLIFGDGPEKDELIEIVKKLNISNNIEFMGQVKNTELTKYYCASDLFVIPSIVVNGHTEGLGVVTIEAMACGTSVIGSNVGGIPDVIINNYNGFLVPEKSEDELAEKINILLSDKTLRNKFIKNGMRTVYEKFSWDVISDKFIQLFRTNLNDLK